MSKMMSDKIFKEDTERRANIWARMQPALKVGEILLAVHG